MAIVAANNRPGEKEAEAELRLGKESGRTSMEQKTRAVEVVPIDWRRARVRERDGNIEDSRTNTRLTGNHLQAGDGPVCAGCKGWN
jgi:hypothetical protein